MTSLFSSSHLIADKWILRERADDKDPSIFSVERETAIVGRHRDAKIAIQHETVSTRHARFSIVDGHLAVTDLSSTNGTYVNGHRLESTQLLKPGDTIQFGKVIFDLHSDVVTLDRETNLTVIDEVFPLAVAEKARRAVPELASSDHLQAWFQPIVQMADRSIFAWEVLARGRMDDLSSAGQIFQAAESQGVAAEISERIRYLGANIASGMGTGCPFFLNTHPHEFAEDRLLASLAQLRDIFPALPLVIEIHEQAVADQKHLKELIAGIRDLGCQFAYDDFGVGSSRILEILEFPPDYVKFDIEFVRRVSNRDIPYDKANSLVNVLKNLNVRLLAEGVETEQQHERCFELGIELGQGYLYGRPLPAEDAFRGA